MTSAFKSYIFWSDTSVLIYGRNFRPSIFYSKMRTARSLGKLKNFGSRIRHEAEFHATQ